MVRAELSRRDTLGGYKVRAGIGRYSYTVDPGLYAIGHPTEESDVLVTANYKLSFDALRRELAGIDAWILVLDTRGINVWCAAGKGTFGTDELVARVASSELARVVSHKRLILPQLGAVGVAGHVVAKRSGFHVVWGPVRAADLPAFLSAGRKADAEMRRVRFPLKDRLVLAPVELLAGLRLTLLVMAALVVLGGVGPGGFSIASLAERWPLAVVSALLALLSGALFTPAALPRLEWRMFSAKGAEIGVLVGLLVMTSLSFGTGSPVSRGDLASAVVLIIAGSSFFAMNYTGTSTYTSVHGAKSEIAASIWWQVGGLVLALLLRIVGGWY